MTQEFDQELTALLPRMRVWALALTRHSAAADDLAQDVAAKVLGAQNTFTPGTNFSAWIHRIMVNHHISGLRRRREFTAMEGLPEVPVDAGHEDRIALRELSWALTRLPADQRQALAMIVLQEKSYEVASEATGEAIGTLKSRVHRARRQLHSHMNGERPLLAAYAARRADPGVCIGAHRRGRAPATSANKNAPWGPLDPPGRQPPGTVALPGAIP